MRRSLLFGLAMAATAVTSISWSSSAIAVSPISVQQGQQLFQRNWTPANRAISSDGLGPLFNGQSCVACHSQGGVGGGGAAEHNAHSIGIEEMQIVGGPVDTDIIKRMVSTFHPGFILSDGTVINTLAMSHHGGSPAFAQSRAAFLKQLPAEFSSHGGPVSAPEVRSATSMPVLFHNAIGKYQMSIRARLFQRNTTALFGAGAIDRVTDSEIIKVAKSQEQHPEISGRPATLRSGKIGKFGWRGNVASLMEFTDQACANEVGLETKRKPQPADPMVPGYRNSGVDISDEQIEAMADFMAALPAPVRDVPGDSKSRMQVERGEQMFASVGCAVCHLPHIGPAREIYSDLLLHDMGHELVDLNHAEPYIIRTTPATRLSMAGTERVTGTMMVGGYYGPATEINVDQTTVSGRLDSGRGGAVRAESGRIDDLPQLPNNRAYYGRSQSIAARPGGVAMRGLHFVAPSVPKERLLLVDLAYDEKNFSSSTSKDLYGLVMNAKIERKSTVRQTVYNRIHFEPTKFNQEWRTPPLWGVRDSAPYMHDGRAQTLLESIAMHGGESAGTRDRFLQLPLSDRHAILAFLNTLAAPPNAPQMAF
ncbi:Cytochrome c [Rubripirellula lacrimiformis]|uniref:Cytochrome c n=1 Tax=Rubripirellula lacrimiformis TaxID=1930273 RepID=A0A517NKS2_9BACT|nr:di-heme oxidoredictase family protein [Rubripirellula lacrimiformis]QDT07679.1 Cytochrome c [Rubripirellula lacrimiformis]